MNTALNYAVALSRRPSQPRAALSAPPEPLWAPVVIRLATAADRRAVERLAQLDSARPPAGETLLGEVQGRAVAAVSLTDGSVIADPFAAAREVVELVALRARQLGSDGRNTRLGFHRGRS
jgi:hypothetical protein